MFRAVWLSYAMIIFPCLGAAEPLPAAKWLVDLGRDYPLSPQAALSDADAEITLLFMQAASRLDPQLAEAYLWQYDMLLSLGREAEARKILGEYVQRQPDDVAAQLNWIHQTANTFQTAEERAEFYRSRLKRPNLSKTVRSDLHRRLAEFHWNRGEPQQAKEEIRLALQQDKFNILADRLQDDIDQRPDSAAKRVENLLAALAINPANAVAAEELGNELGALGWPLDAARWYRHAIKMYELLPPGYPPLTLLLREAQALIDGGKLDEVETRARQIAEKQPSITTDVMRAMLAVHRGETAAAREALAKAGPDAIAAAISVLSDASASTRPVGTQPEESDSERLLREWVKPAPSKQAAADIRAALDAFPTEVLKFPGKPEQFISLELNTATSEKNLTEPWWCTIQLKNIGPFPILLGAGAMVAPELLCSIETKGDRTRTSGPIIRIPLNRQLQLQPGETLEVTQTLSIGPIRSSMIGTPQATHDVEVTAVLNPVRLINAEGNELWAPGIGGLLAKPLQFRRLGEVPTAEQMRELVLQSQGGEPAKRIAALEIFAMFLAEHQHLAAGRLSYSARRMDAQKLQAVVLARANDADANVRARLAECMRWFILDKTATQAGTGLLNDSHWLVRGLAARMLADHYRDKFTPVLKRLADTDPDDWVRHLNAALLARTRMISTQPAGVSATVENKQPLPPPTPAPISKAAPVDAAPSKSDQPLLSLPEEKQTPPDFGPAAPQQ